MNDLWSVWGVNGSCCIAEIKIFSNEQCTEGDSRGREGVLDKTAAPRIVFEWMIHHTTVLVRGVCVCAVHLTVNLRSIVGQGEEEDPSCTSSDAYKVWPTNP